jgi:hypothetical protein
MKFHVLGVAPALALLLFVTTVNARVSLRLGARNQGLKNVLSSAASNDMTISSETILDDASSGDLLDLTELASIAENAQTDVKIQAATTSLLPSATDLFQDSFTTSPHMLALNSIKASLRSSQLTNVSFDKQLSDITASILELAKTGQSPALTQAFINAIRNILNSNLKQFLVTMSQQATSDVATSFGAVLSCTTTFRPPSPTNLTSLSQAHCACRAQQRDCSLKAANAEQACNIMNSSCSYTLPVFDGKAQCKLGSCAMNQGQIQQYLMGQVQFWQDQYSLAKSMRLQCENATQACYLATQASSQCMTTQATLAAQCQVAQNALDEAACQDMYQAQRTQQQCQSCQVINNCTNVTLQQKITAAQSLQVQLQQQMNTVKQVECYLGALLTPNCQASIQQCQQTTYYNDPEVTALVLPPSLTSGTGLNCTAPPLPSPPWPCGFYGACSAFAGNCTASCCRGASAGTR